LKRIYGVESTLVTVYEPSAKRQFRLPQGKGPTEKDDGITTTDASASCLASLLVSYRRSRVPSGVRHNGGRFIPEL